MDTSSGIKKNTEEVSLRIDWTQLNQLESQLKAAFRNICLWDSKQLSIVIGCTSQGLFLRIRNASGCSARSCSSTSKSNSLVSNNYMNANDVFSLPKISYADKSTQCNAVADVNPPFASSMFFHPYRLKPNRQIKCIQCGNTSSFGGQ
uniref:Uncharacterized protein n=1 Tax=Ditylenchus dipsaci TaxID=166011 RepID=A0A915DLF9_9BILA